MAAPEKRDQSALSGGLFAILAYSLWGVLPFYWKAIQRVPAIEILCHRVLWGVLGLALFFFVRRRWGRIYKAWSTPKVRYLVIASALLVGSNWVLYVYAINSGRILSASLGYFINPLMSVLLGAIFLRERLRIQQKLAVLLATIGVGIFVIHFGALPWIALGLATTFGFYGLLRKVTQIDVLSALLIEVLILSAPAVIYLIYRHQLGSSHFLQHGIRFDMLLMLAGPVTIVPLILFGAAAKRIMLATLGFFQYIAPSLNFILAVFIYQESFTRAHQITFALIWTALLLYTLDSLGYRPLAKLRTSH